nr:PAS domain S-box protein [Deltaproteobacteria bacterium]
KRIFVLSVVLGLGVGLIDSIIDYFMFYEKAFLDILFFNVPATEFFMRSIILAVFVIYGFTTSKIIFNRNQIAEVLRVSEERYRTIIENIKAGYYEADLGGYFTFLTDSFCKTTGFSEKEMLGKNYLEFTAPEGIKKANSTFNEVYKTQKSVQGFDWDLINKNETQNKVEISISIIKGLEGRCTGFRGLIREV